jgi:hypothetical protein
MIVTVEERRDIINALHEVIREYAENDHQIARLVCGVSFFEKLHYALTVLPCPHLKLELVTKHNPDGIFYLHNTFMMPFPVFISWEAAYFYANFETTDLKK